MKKITATVLCLLLALSLIGCKTTKIPPIEDVASYSIDEFEKLRQTVTEQDLVKVWGAPQTVNSQRIWTVPQDGAPKYIIAWVDNGKISSMGVSTALYVTVVQKENNLALGLVDFNDYTKDLSMLTFLPPTDIFGNEIHYEVGELYYFEFDGMLMETYPQQINRPYFAMLMGKLTKEELEEIEQLLSQRILIYAR